MRTIDADALLADFKARAIKARNWKENAILNGNEEATIRADATIAFLTEVKLTIENAPTVGVEPDCSLKQFGECSYNETGCSDCFIKERIRRALDEKAYEIGHADGARLGYEKGLKEASNYSEGWMDGYNHAIDQIFKELNYLLKNHVIEELRKRIKR